MQEVDHTKNIIEAENITFSYDHNKVLSNINLKIHKGDYLVLAGPNGAGKTTLLKIMLNLLSPDQGQVKLFNKNIEEFKDWSKVGYVSQRVTDFDLNFPATAYEVVLMGRYGKRGILHQMTKEDHANTVKALKDVGMYEHRDILIGNLSGGQQQRIFIARALAAEPEIIFLDEPTTGVDLAAQDDFYKLLRILNRDFKLTLVLISHDVERVANEAMHIAYINHSLTFCESPDEFVKIMRDKNLNEDILNNTKIKC